jgi:hypothetical protein
MKERYYETGGALPGQEWENVLAWTVFLAAMWYFFPIKDKSNTAKDREKYKMSRVLKSRNSAFVW